MNIPLEKSVRLLSPRTMVVVTSISKKGMPNAAPYSWAFPVSFNPPLIGAGIQKKNTRTYRNVLETKEFVLHVVTREWGQQAVDCEEKVGDEINKLDKVGLETIPSKRVKPPTIKKAKIVLECVLHEILEPTGADHLIVVGKVVAAHASEEKSEVLMHDSGGTFFVPGEKVELQRRK